MNHILRSLILALFSICIILSFSCSRQSQDDHLLEDINLKQGVVHGNLGKYSEAISDCDKVIALNPKRTLAYNNRGSYNYKLHNYSLAVSDYTKAIEIDPKYADAYHGRGSAYAALNDHRRAIKDYDKALELDPKHVDTHYNRAKAYYNLRQYEQAIKDYDKAIELDPKQPDAYCGRGTAYAALDNHKRAIEDYDKAIRLDLKYAKAYYARAMSYYELHQYERAYKDYGKAIELDPKQPNTYFGRGSVNFMLSKYQQAIKDYDKAIELEPKIALTYALRGNAYSEAGRYDNAIKEFDRAMKLSPNDPEIFNNFAWFLATCKGSKYRDGKKAVKFAQKAVELSEKKKDSRLGDYYDTLAAAYAEVGDFDKAALTQSKACELYKQRNAGDETQIECKQLVETYKGKQTYMQWKNINQGLCKTSQYLFSLFLYHSLLLTRVQRRLGFVSQEGLWAHLIPLGRTFPFYPTIATAFFRLNAVALRRSSIFPFFSPVYLMREK